MKDKIIELVDLRKSYGNFEALKGINLSLGKNEILGFIGPNGAGKTTTIRIILGMLKASGGKSLVFGKDSWKDSVEIHKKLSYVPGDVNFWPNLTGGEIIDFFLKMRNQKQNSKKFDLIEKFDLDPRKKSKAYSKGNRQKIALISALSADVDLYIFDEPTSGLDPLMEEIFQQEVRRLRNEGKSIILSSHILSEVEKLCDSISIVKDGKIIENGKLEDMKLLTMTKFKVKTKISISDISKFKNIYDCKFENGFLTFSVQKNNISKVISELSKYEIISLESKNPSLEDLFMSHYERD